LLYEVLRDIGDGPVVVSPWVKMNVGAAAYYERRDVQGSHHARVRPDGSNWKWYVYGRDHGDPWGKAPDEAAAMRAADAKMVEFGYLLAGVRRPEKLAMPWGQRSGSARSERRDAASGELLVEVGPTSDGLWHWTGYPDRTTTINRGMGDRNEAMWAADRWLERQGWELAG